MVKFSLKLIGVALTGFLLFGCSDDQSEAYLITHPEVLGKRMEECANISLNASKQQIESCKIIISVSNQFVLLLKEQQANAEKFGMRVLMAQSQYKEAEAKLQQARAKLAQLKASNAKTAVIDKALSTMAKAQTAYDAKEHEVQVLLAVLGLSTPD